MAPLVFLLGTFAVLFLVNRFFLSRVLSMSFIGRASIAVMLVITGISHFTNTTEMVGMMPDLMPAKLEIVYFTGICELAAVPGLLWNRTARGRVDTLDRIFCPGSSGQYRGELEVSSVWGYGIRRVVSPVSGAAADLFCLVGLVFRGQKSEIRIQQSCTAVTK